MSVCNSQTNVSLMQRLMQDLDVKLADQLIQNEILDRYNSGEYLQPLTSFTDAVKDALRSTRWADKMLIILLWCVSSAPFQNVLFTPQDDTKRQLLMAATKAAFDPWFRGKLHDMRNVDDHMFPHRQEDFWRHDAILNPLTPEQVAEIRKSKPTPEQAFRIKQLKKPPTPEEINKAHYLRDQCADLRHLAQLKHLMTFGWHMLQLRSFWLRL